MAYFPPHPPIDYTAGMVTALTSDLYYDLMEKYVRLDAKHKIALDTLNKLKIDNSAKDMQLALYRNHSLYPHKQIKHAYVCFIRQIIRILHSYKREDALREIKSLEEV